MRLESDGNQVEVSDEVFACEMNQPLVHQVLVSYMAGSRQGSKSQKTRSDVTGGGKKPWRQKGTGRARAGTSRSPLWRSGGVTFGARPRNFSQKVNRKMYQSAMRCVLSELVRDDRLIVVDDVKIDSPKTKLFVSWLKTKATQSALVVVKEPSVNLHLASRNVYSAKVITVFELDPISLVNFDKLIITTEALKEVESRFSTQAA